MEEMTLLNVRLYPGGPWVQVPAIIGPQGPRGERGEMMRVEDVYPTLAALRAAFPGGNNNMYLVEENNECYVWSETENDWVSVGSIQGPPGDDGADGADGQDGITPTIGDNGNWYLGDTDTGKPSRGIKGDTGAQGPQGIQGIQGEQGPEGPRGPSGIIESATAPTDTTKFWRDTTENKIKYYDAAAQQWKAVGSGGGASTWSEVQNKPFSTIGSGLTVENDELKATGGGGSDMTDDEALDYAYEVGLVEPFAQSGYVLFTDSVGKIFVTGGN